MEDPHRSCIACLNPKAGFYFKKSTLRATFNIIKCQGCGSAFAWPRPDHLEAELYYRNDCYHNLTPEKAIIQDRRYHPDSHSDAQRILAVCTRLARGPRFLDIGAGFGAFSAAAAEHGFSVSACEPNPNARKIFSALNGFQAEDAMFDDSFALHHPDAFDVILLSHVLEHTPDPDAVAGYCRRVLRNEGLAAVAVPHFGSALSRMQGKRDMFISPPEHLNYFSKNGLISLFERNGFQLLELNTTSKIHRARFEEIARVPLFRSLVWRTLYGALAFWDPFAKGMVINAFFRKRQSR